MKKLFTIIAFCCFVINNLLHAQTYSEITYDAGTIIEITSGADVCATDIHVNGTYTGGGTICSGPLPVTLTSFTYSVNRNNVTLTWITQTEINNSGFEVERKEAREGSQWNKIASIAGFGTTNEPKTYLFEDKKLMKGIYSYRIKQIDFNGNFEYFQLQEEVRIIPPNIYSMSQSYPNPSNPKSKIDFELPQNSLVTIKIYNLLGQEVMLLINEMKEAGYYTSEFDGTYLASGVYFYRMEVKEQPSGKTFTDVKKMLLVK